MACRHTDVTFPKCGGSQSADIRSVYYNTLKILPFFPLSLELGTVPNLRSIPINRFRVSANWTERRGARGYGLNRETTAVFSGRGIRPFRIPAKGRSRPLDGENARRVPFDRHPLVC